MAAELEGVEHLDLSRALEVRHVVDGVHTTPFGAEALADRIAEALLMPTAPALDLEARLAERALPATRTDYHGFARFDFRLGGRANDRLHGDGIHITRAGQEAWMEALGPVVESVLLD